MAAPTPATRLSSYCRAIQRRPALVELKLCLLAAVFVALEGPHLCGFSSQGAYAREALGMSAPSFSRRRRIGLFLLNSRRARVGLLRGQFGIAALDLLLRRCGPQAAEALLDLLPNKSLQQLDAELNAIHKDAREIPEAPPAHTETPDSAPVRLNLRVPEPLARLLQQNQQLASLLCGGLDDASSNAMWIAEAASESSLDPETADPWRILGLKPPSIKAPRPHTPLPRVELSLPKPIKQHRRKMAQFDQQLVALAREHRQARGTFRDQLFALYQEFAWYDLGYPSAESFAEAELSMTPRSWWQALADARRRRRNDPVANALASGDLGDWAARRLDAFRKSAHVGASGIQAWVEAAQQLSCVALQQRIDLAKQWARFNPREYSLRGWPVPTEADLRAPECSLKRLLEGPDLPTEIALLSTPRIDIVLELSRPALAELLSLWSTIHRERQQHHPDTSPWTSLLLILARARLGMLQLALAHDEPVRAHIHWRDQWRCANPTCGSFKRLHSHHIHPLGRGGPDTPENQITLCERCHIHLLHQGLLRITGKAGDPQRPLRFEMSFNADGRARRVFHGNRRGREGAILSQPPGGQPSVNGK